MRSGASEIKAARVSIGLLTGLAYSSVTFSGDQLAPVAGDHGFGWLQEGIARIYQVSEEEVVVVQDFCTATWFVKSGGSYSPRFGALDSLIFNSHHCRFIFRDCTGTVWIFDSDGALVEVKRPNNYIWRAVQFTPLGQIARYERLISRPGRPIRDLVEVEYYESGPNEGRVRRETHRREMNPTVDIRRVVYSYYGDDEPHGNLGDLRTVAQQILRGTEWVDHETSYFRYYKEGEPGGFEHGLKYSLSSGAFSRLAASVSGDPLDASDSVVAQHADHYYEYDEQQRATKSVLSGGVYTYLYSYTESENSEDYNHWKLKVVEARSDGSQEIVYSNFIGEPLLTILAKSGESWFNYHLYDATSREILHASPSAVISFDENEPDLAVQLRTDAGLINLTEYYGSTTATESTPGGVEGFIHRKLIQEGTGGTPILQSEMAYFRRESGGTANYPIASSTVFRNDDGSGAITTSFGYTWHDDSLQVKEQTTTLPVVPSEQNGDGETHTQVQIFDSFGFPLWEKNARGFITYREFDLVTGALVEQIDDVDMDLMEDAPEKPDWTTPAGGGIHAITSYESDLLGRTVQVLGPWHQVSGGVSVRTASWTVYRDLEDETWSGQGYAVGLGPEYDYTLVNPVSISRASGSHLVSDSITAVRCCTPCDDPSQAPTESGGRLSSHDCFPQSTWIRWSRTLSDQAGRAIASRTYHVIPASGEGLPGVNYDETRFAYDVMGRQNETIAPGGGVVFTLFDVRGLATETWVGTDENNLVQTVANVYDEGSDGGDGNLTQTKLFIDDDPAHDRVTNYTYDFRGRRTSEAGEADAYSEMVYDNLNHVVRVDRRDGGATGDLIARSETFYDNRGQAYQSVLYEVDPATGTVGNKLIDNTWHDAVGSVVQSQSSGSEAWNRFEHDGLGRTIRTMVGYTDEEDDDKVFEQTDTVYDAAGNVLQTTLLQRYHDNDVSTGPLLADVTARPQYTAYWHDGLGRVVIQANYGTNNGEPFIRPDAPPEA